LYLYSGNKQKEVMAIRESLNKQLSVIPAGEVFTLSDIDMPRQYQGALAKALSQYAAMGNLKRISKGRYYKPRQTRFGELHPGVEQVVKKFLYKNGEVIGYLTGTEAFAELGLTTQVSGDIMIGTNNYKRPVQRGAYKITFLLQPNPINIDDFPLFRILDALRLIKTIPATTTDESIIQLGNIISNLEESRRNRLINLAKQYPPFVRALLGASLEAHGLSAERLYETLNATTAYKLSLSDQSLPTKKKWNIQ